MINKVGIYLDMASSEKKLERFTPWNGLGARFVSLKTRTYIYLGLVLLGSFFRITACITEDYPGKIRKPEGLILWDGLVEGLQSTIILLSAGFPFYLGIWYLLSGIAGLGTSIGKACLIANIVEPLTPIETERDRFNVLGYGCANAIKWLYPLLARPVDDSPLMRPDEPFYTPRHRGVGLNNQERQELLRVVVTV